MINVLGFSSCGLGCECGCRVVLGVTRADARRLRVILEREFGLTGLSFQTTTNPATGEPIEPAGTEPLYAWANEPFKEYAS